MKGTIGTLRRGSYVQQNAFTQKMMSSLQAARISRAAPLTCAPSHKSCRRTFAFAAGSFGMTNLLIRHPRSQ